MRQVIVYLLFLIPCIVHAQTLYSKSFGNPQDKPLLFVHEGPGNNCAGFEFTTAQRMADQGFYVIVYDRRGEGRSTDPNAEYSIAEASVDIQGLMQQYQLQKITLLGHRFGGMLAVLFARIHPELVQAVVLIGTPISLQESYTQIITRCKTIYETKNELSNLKYMGLLQAMDPTSIMYASYCMLHAQRNGLFRPQKPTLEAQKIYKSIQSISELKKWNDQFTQEAVLGFAQNDNYTTLNLSEFIQQLNQKNINVYGFYGQDDGFFSNEQMSNLEHLLPENYLYYWPQCASNVFIDQQTLFVETLKKRL